MFRALIVWLFLHLALVSHASHVMGGEITYKHLGGGNYQFELVFYRDCNGADINAVSETLRVWNHPTLSVLPVLFVQRQDLSPSCTQVPGGAGPLICGTGNNGGNGIGAIEKVIYRSAPIALSGNPPAQGWAFTYENFSRSGAVTNLSNPASYGMTLVAKIFNLSEPDDSPVFNEDPNFVSCAGLPYQYNAAVSDANFDSLAFEFGVPYDHFPAGVYNPPANPAPIPYVTGFSFTNPTPGTAINANNIPAVLDPLNGNLTFTSFTVGNYTLKIVVKAFRSGVLISETEREMQLILQPCNNSNFPPIIAPPFAAGTSYELTVNAGDLIDVPLLITDPDVQSNGSPQNITLDAQLPCTIGPCPSLNIALPFTAASQIQAQFTWQTTCDHLLDGQGQAQAQQTYHFVLKATDDICPIPQVQYATLTIHVLNTGISTPEISCIQTASNNELQIYCPPMNPSNPSNFATYQVYSLQNGLLGTISSINTNNLLLAPINAIHDFYLGMAAGCNGQFVSYSDTIKNILLTLNNPNNGTAVLNWNKPHAQALPAYNSHYYIYREYPTNFFNFIDSVPYNQTTYTDTIDICSAFISYKVVLPTLSCNFTSNLAGDNFNDLFTPYIPAISSVGFDTSTQQMLVQWNVNAAPDTYGYIVYTYDTNGFLIELDTVYGQNNTTYQYSVPFNGGPYTYTVAAFDSCYTASNPPSFQTSAKANLHTSIQASYLIDMCPQLAKLNWSRYLGSGVLGYQIWSKHNNTWTLLHSTTDTSASVALVRNESYCLYVKANLQNGFSAFSNPLCFTMPQPTPPGVHYFRVASVNEEDIELKVWIDASVGINEVQFERKDTNGLFELIGTAPVSNNSAYFLDDDVDTQWGPWTYRTVYIDSCGATGSYANENTTIFVTGSTDPYKMINSLSWTPYTQFAGSISSYQVFRNAYGSWETIPVQVLPDGSYSITDDVSKLRNNGEVCYQIMALENVTQTSFTDSSFSNIFCLQYEPLMFVPNAFTPDGLNPIFLPVVQNVDPEKYTFSIIDRWGKIVFETNDPAAGWDGIISSSGLPATNDVFQYRIELIINKTDAIVKQGYVTLIR